MKKAVKIILGIVVVLVLVLVGFLWYMGIFDKVDVVEKETGPYRFVYQDFVGDYSKVGEPMNKIYENLKKDGIETTKGLGIYFDDPKTVSADKLRSQVGSIVEEPDYPKLDKLADKYTSLTLIKHNRIYAEFPYKNSLSIIAGVLKVYPAFESYIKEKNYNMTHTIELYDINNGKIIYMMEIGK